MKWLWGCGYSDWQYVPIMMLPPPYFTQMEWCFVVKQCSFNTPHVTREDDGIGSWTIPFFPFQQHHAMDLMVLLEDSWTETGLGRLSTARHLSNCGLMDAWILSLSGLMQANSSSPCVFRELLLASYSSSKEQQTPNVWVCFIDQSTSKLCIHLLNWSPVVVTYSNCI